MFKEARIGYIALSALVIWVALGLQLYLFFILAISHRMSLIRGLLDYLSYFTNISNLLAGLILLFALFYAGNPKKLSLIAKQISGVVVFMCMAGIVFNVELNSSESHQGLSHVANVLLHDVTPIFFLTFWWFYIPHSQLKIKDALIWITFPMLYFIYLMTRGYLLGHYPYPFVNVAMFGFRSVFWKGLEILAGFLIVGLIFVALDAFKLKATSN